MIDLHTHSTASDGVFSPSALVEKAAAEGLSALALTDHDSLDGLDEAAEAAKSLGLRFVPGIEIEIAFAPGEFHLLGLDFGRIQQELVDAAKELALSRDERNRSVFDKLGELGLDLDYDAFKREQGTGMIGRPHIADYLVRKGIVKTKQDAFDRYLAKGRPFFVQKACLQLERAVALIKDSGGLAIVAHPLSLFVSWTRMRVLMGEWKELGLDGIEAWHPTARVVDCERLEALGREFGFRISAGSDYHGPSRPDRRLGRTAGARPIDDGYLAALER
ncbi:MAG TPA: PHP domain-containing protein [Spirochaetaceae bacterium]|jgi:predicted metal-dependent phosphoesterase TrpH|nr:PHP domain-containing protein [Spirochaetaceae bacterium]